MDSPSDTETLIAQIRGQLVESFEARKGRPVTLDEFEAIRLHAVNHVQQLAHSQANLQGPDAADVPAVA